MKRKEMRPQRPDNPRAHRTVGRSQQHIPHYINIAGFGTFEVREFAKLVAGSLVIVLALFALIWGMSLACVTFNQWGWL